jgi:hypothetical protein
VELRPIAVGSSFPPAVITSTGHSNVLGFTFDFANDPVTGQTPNPVRHSFGIFGPAGAPVTHSGDNLVYFLTDLPPTATSAWPSCPMNARRRSTFSAAAPTPSRPTLASTGPTTRPRRASPPAFT